MTIAGAVDLATLTKNNAHVTHHIIGAYMGLLYVIIDELFPCKPRLATDAGAFVTTVRYHIVGALVMLKHPGVSDSKSFPCGYLM